MLPRVFLLKKGLTHLSHILFRPLPLLPVSPTINRAQMSFLPLSPILRRDIHPSLLFYFLGLRLGPFSRKKSDFRRKKEGKALRAREAPAAEGRDIERRGEDSVTGGSLKNTIFEKILPGKTMGA